MRRLALTLALAATVASAPRGAWAAAALEMAVKAAYLYRFAAFVQWPPGAFNGPGTPAQICIAGDDPFGNVLDQAVKGKKIANHPISIVRLDRVDKAPPCQILFVAPSPRRRVAETLDKVRGSPILTVTDSGADPADRGVIDFVLQDNRVRFRIDGRAAVEGGLAISSKLRRLAIGSGGPP
ncbi:MAG: putative transrane protein [Caulobacteraceae bacterium]|nr:putative transrane protein [Caulobacteraceae bacterium]